jgi:hypothetical protein
MISNSKIITSSIFGVSSGKTAQELEDINRQALEKLLNENNYSSLASVRPRVPSNQRIATEK